MNIRRFCLLNKRLFRQATYVALLLLIPVLVLMLKLSAESGGHLMEIALYEEDGGDELSHRLVEDLLSIREEMHLNVLDSEEAAVEAVTMGTADEAWVVPKNLDEAFLRMARGRKPKNPVKIYVRENVVTNLMLQEILEGYAYKYLAPEIYRSFLLDEFGEAASETFSEKNYQKRVPTEPLFQFSYIDGSQKEEAGYLLSPIRGLLAVMLVITSLAASIYYLEDEKNGLFIYWQSGIPNLRALGYYGIVMMNSSVLVLFSLYLAGIAGNLFEEILLLILYNLSLIFFSMLVRIVFGKIKTIGVLIPVFVILSLIMSPVFIDLKSMRLFQQFVPTFHYLLGVHNARSILNLLIYCIVEIVLLELFGLFKRKWK